MTFRALAVVWVLVLPGAAQAQRVTCRAGPVHGLEGVKAALRPATEENDAAALTFLTERLAEVIGGDANAALQVVEWADTAVEPGLSVLLHGVREAPAAKDARVVARLFSMAEGHADPRHQVLALEALETQERLGATDVDRLVGLAMKDSRPPGVAWQAARTLGRVMKNGFQSTGTLAPYMARLLDVARGAPDSNVRVLAVEMGTYPAARLDEATVKELGRLMREDPDAHVREMAALLLSNGRDTQAVLARYRDAFPAEKSLCVRRALLLNTVRAGGEESLPQVQEYARLDRRFAQDVADFKALYAAGHTDFDRLWLSKKTRQSCPEE